MPEHQVLEVMLEQVVVAQTLVVLVVLEHLVVRQELPTQVV
jgi:hypothetical protein